MVGRRWREMGKRMTGSAICLVLLLVLLGCSQQPSSPSRADNALKGIVAQSPNLEEVSAPDMIQQLRRSLGHPEPRVKIVGLKPDTTISQTTASIRFEVEDFPIFKDSELSMGPHLQVLLDNQPYTAIYDPKQTVTFKDLTPGTHLIRVFASSPWNESIKAPTAFDQLTFNVFAPTQANHPEPTQPLLTYSQPQGEYGAEPILLDYILTPAVSKTKGAESAALTKPKVRITVNGNSFTTENQPPFYLRGFKQGTNWIKVELLSPNGKPMTNPLSETLQLITLKSRGSDTLSKLVRGELTAQDAEQIVSLEVSQRRAAQKLEALSAPKVSEPAAESKVSDSVLPSPSIAPATPKPTSNPPSAGTMKRSEPDVTDAHQTLTTIPPEPTGKPSPAAKSNQPIPKPASAMNAPIQSFLKRFRQPQSVPSKPPQLKDVTVPEADGLSKGDSSGRFARSDRPTPTNTEGKIPSSAAVQPKVPERTKLDEPIFAPLPESKP